jgi:hypothetical protein
MDISMRHKCLLLKAKKKKEKTRNKQKEISKK